MNTETTIKPGPVANASRDDRFPSQIKYIIGNEACERFSYYGMQGLLQVYLATRLGMGDEKATERLHLFGTAVYFMPLFGGWLADRWLGRYWTILIISLFYCLGHGTLSLFEGNSTGLFVGLALIAIGAGGIKPCVSAFVGDQFGPNQDRALTRVYGWFYWAINLGATAALIIVPFVKEKWGYGWAFGVPGIFMAVATFFFWLGRKQYVRQPPAAQTTKRAGFLSVFFYALANRSERKPGQSMFDVALKAYSREEVDGAKAVIGIVKIFITIPVFWALFNQIYSTWIVQGNKMTKFDLFGYVVDGERMQAAGSILVMIWVPILTFIVYPMLERFGILPTALRRMSAGMVLGAVSFVICGLLQWHMDRGATLSVLWQLLPYVVLEAAEVMLSATALEFAFSQAPASMKSTITSFWLMTIAGGHFLISVISNLNVNYVHAKGAVEFWFYAVLMFVVAGMFIFLASRYRERPMVVAPLSPT